jgi:hypothetical protein
LEGVFHASEGGVHQAIRRGGAADDQQSLQSLGQETAVGDVAQPSAAAGLVLRSWGGCCCS